MLGFVAGDMYDKESESDSDLCVYVCVGRGVVCRVERGLRKPVLHKLNFIP